MANKEKPFTLLCHSNLWLHGEGGKVEEYRRGEVIDVSLEDKDRLIENSTCFELVNASALKLEKRNGRTYVKEETEPGA